MGLRNYDSWKLASPYETRRDDPELTGERVEERDEDGDIRQGVIDWVEHYEDADEDGRYDGWTLCVKFDDGSKETYDLNDLGDTIHLVKS